MWALEHTGLSSYSTWALEHTGLSSYSTWALEHTGLSSYSTWALEHTGLSSYSTWALEHTGLSSYSTWALEHTGLSSYSTWALEHTGLSSYSTWALEHTGLSSYSTWALEHTGLSSYSTWALEHTGLSSYSTCSPVGELCCVTFHQLCELSDYTAVGTAVSLTLTAGVQSAGPGVSLALFSSGHQYKSTEGRSQDHTDHGSGPTVVQGQHTLHSERVYQPLVDLQPKVRDPVSGEPQQGGWWAQGALMVPRLQIPIEFSLVYAQQGTAVTPKHHQHGLSQGTVGEATESFRNTEIDMTSEKAKDIQARLFLSHLEQSHFKTNPPTPPPTQFTQCPETLQGEREGEKMQVSEPSSSTLYCSSQSELGRAVEIFPSECLKDGGVFVALSSQDRVPKEKLHENGDLFLTAKNPLYRKVVNAGGYSDGGEERTGVVCTVGLLSPPFVSWHRHLMGHFSLVIAAAYSKAAHFGTLCISP
ncbi:hypothetical protein M91_04468 [Bos mutus]|uniref:Uncharacterized protein n=1 Tax=Bos mutus TaxID=72004 RepID=L8IWX9_9CETA|nr:hypothetical protein M91_04468 [Bos mutus]